MNKLQLLLVLVGYLIVGCSTTETFHHIARAGDTVALPVGNVEGVTRSNLQVTFTPQVGGPIVFLPGEPVSNPVVRAVVNLYPDPVSKLVVGSETNQSMGVNASLFGSVLENSLANFEKDWWNTVVFLDLPDTLPTGTTTIDLLANTQSLNQASIDIIAPSGSPNPFNTNEGGPLSSDHIQSMERADHYVLDFTTASSIPYAIEVNLIHDPIVDNGGSGRPHVINPRGDITNIMWKDDGTSMKIILMPAKLATLGRMQYFKIFVAGDIFNLQEISTMAYDINGAVVNNVTTSVTLVN